MILKHKSSLLGHNSAIYKLVDRVGTDFFYSLAGDGMVVKWNKNGDPDGWMIANAEEQIFTGIYLAERDWLVMGGMNGHLIWLDLAEKSIIKKVKQHSRSIYGICQIGPYLFTASGDGTICKWDIQTQMPIISLQVSNQGLRCLMSKDEHLLFVGGSDHYIYLVDTITLKILYEIEGHRSSVFSLSFGNKGLLYSGGRDAMLAMWVYKDARLDLINSLAAHMYTVNDILSYKDLIFTASRDKKIRVWTPDLVLLQSVDYRDSGHVNSVNSIIIDTEKNLLFSASDDRKINIWEINKLGL